MKKIILLLFLFTGLLAQSQVYNNEWINYSRTYYKFKIGATALFRITQPTLHLLVWEVHQQNNFNSGEMDNRYLYIHLFKQVQWAPQIILSFGEK